jgi:hypothetical protein
MPKGRTYSGVPFIWPKEKHLTKGDNLSNYGKLNSYTLGHLQLNLKRFYTLYLQLSGANVVQNLTMSKTYTYT